MKLFFNASAVQKASGTPMSSTAEAMQKLLSRTSKTLLHGVKIAAVLILTACLQASATTTDAQKLSISIKNGSLEKLFSEIEKKTTYVFFYDVAILKGTRPVTVEEKEATVEDILAKSLRGQSLDFSIHDRTIFVKKGGDRPVTMAPAPGGPDKGVPPAVRGIVKSEAGTPLMGASVMIKQLKKSGMTNEYGEFVMRDVPNGEYEVEISFVGYETKTTMITVENHEARIFADLKQSSNNVLDETVVKGYYSTTNRLNTGNVTKVKGEDIQKQPVSDPIMALEGRVPGMYIAQASGMPGAAYTIKIRGQNSIASGNNPLYIVDGVPFTANTLTSPYVNSGALGKPNAVNPSSGSAGQSPFNSLNPADIESIEVLKDADATAIYGSRGANGVVLITTKKGKAGQTKVDVNVYSGAGKITHKLNLLNTQQYLALRHEAFNNDGVQPDPNYDYDITGAWDTTRYTDWQKVLIGGTAKFTNAQASISGGNNNTQFVLGGGYSRQTTVFPGSYSDQKASTHISLNHVSDNQRFRALFSAQYVYDNNRLPQTDLSSQITTAPDAPAIYDSKGNLNWQNGTFVNPFAYTLQKAGSVTDNLIGNLNLGYEILPGLQVKSSFGYTHIQMNQSNQTPATVSYGPPLPTTRINSFGTSNINTWIIEPQMTYNKRMGQGKLDALIGVTVQRNTQSANGFIASNFLNDALIPNISAASTLKTTGNNFTEYRYNAAFGRIGYNWNDKYLINLTGRRDGSSRFGPGKQFGNFGAVGAAWIFSKEKFIERALPFLSFGKLRVSYGTTGNDQISDYQYLSSYLSYSTTPYQNVTGLYPSRIANPYFGWEVVKKLEGGIDLGWLKDRIILNASFYRNRTGNQLVGLPLPNMDGFTTVQANLPAIVQNTGVELELNTINIQSKNFTWSTSINFSLPRNKLIAYPNLSASSYVNAYAIGKSLFIKKLYHSTGVDPQTGLYTFEDLNKDGQITSPQDMQFSKQIAQNYFGGVQNKIAYKGWQLDVLFQFIKQTGQNYLNIFPIVGFFDANQPTEVLNHWKQPGDHASIQKLTQGANDDAVNAYFNALSYGDQNVIDASFIRLKNLALSYTLPTTWQRKAHLQNARVYIQCQNLFTITQYKGVDPESQGQSLPPLRMITGGLQIAL